MGSIRTVDIAKLFTISDHLELVPNELRVLGIVLIFDILYDADVFTQSPDQRGGTWGVHFSHAERRQALVKLQLNGYLETKERVFHTGNGENISQRVYLITENGRALLKRLKEAAGIE